MPKTVILGAARTPIGKMGGGLSSLDATELGGIAIEAALERSGVEPAQVEHVIMGQVLQAGQGQIPSRQAQIKAGIPKEVSSETINKVCASGMRAAVLLDQAIRAGDVQIGVAGGMESMSQAPYLLPGARFGRFGAGGGSCANGTPNAAGCTSKPDVAPTATDVRPAAAAPIAATAAAPVASIFTVMAVPSIWT